MEHKTPIDILIEKGYDDVIVFRNPDYTNALIGITDNYQAVYDYYLMIEWLINYENMDFEEAADFISWNDSFYYGDKYPIIYYDDEEFDEEFDEEKQFTFTRIEFL